STFRINPQQVRDQQYHWQWQHFRGWFIETKQAQFHSNQATLMDFRVPQKNDARFLYVLPFSEHRALVEFTGFSNEFYAEQEYEEVLKHYIVQQLGITDYEVSERESGAIPMTDWSVDRHPSPHVIRIGTAGGQVKPTTGYAFWNIQLDCQAMADSLLSRQKPAFRPATSARYRFYDRLLLNILQENGHRAQGIFTALFKHNQMRRILRFMGESTQVWEEVILFSQLPWAPFFQAIANTHPVTKRWQTWTKSRQYPVKI
ncbi:MAG: lycopene cyclase family protein, partial [Bacteroidota bacterium]